MEGTPSALSRWWQAKSPKSKRRTLVLAGIFTILLGIAIAFALGTFTGAPTTGSVNTSTSYTVGATTVTGDSVTGCRVQFPKNYDVSTITGVTSTRLTGITYTLDVPNRILTVSCTAYTTAGRTITLVIAGVTNASQPGSYSYGASWRNLGSYMTTQTFSTTLASLGTAPASNDTTCSDNLESTQTTYTVNIGLGAQGRVDSTAAAGVNTMTVEFDPAYTLPSSWSNSDVTVNGTACSNVTISGQRVTVSVPSGVGIGGSGTASIVFRRAFGLVNPVAGSYVTSASTSAETGEVQSAAYTIAASGPPPTTITLETSQTPSADYVSRDETVCVAGFSLQRTAGSSSTVATSATITDTGTVPSTNVGGVYVYRDDGSKTFDAADTLLNATGGTFSGSTAQAIFDADETVDGTARLYWVVYRMGSSASDGAKASAKVTALTHSATNLTNNGVVGNAFTVDINGPTTSITSPPSSDVVTGTALSINGNATDAASGVATNNITIQRVSDSAYWTGSAWDAAVTTLGVTPSGANWSYLWTLPTDDHSTSYVISAWGVDLNGNIGPTAQVTNLVVDNVGPACASASAVNSTTVSVTFSEQVTTASAEATNNYTIAGLTVTDAILSGDGRTVFITTTPQSDMSYTVVVDSTHSVYDLFGNHSQGAPFDSQPFFGTDGLIGGDVGGSLSSTYSTWTPGGANSGSLPTPHKDFRLTTEKCAVCHAVHKAASAGEVLLRSTITNACLYCHVDNMIGNIRIYNGVASNYTVAYATAHGGDVLCQCVDCHSVHGSNTMTGTVSAKILKYGGWEATLTAIGGASYDATNGVHDGQITLFCTKCHPYFVNAYTTSGSAAHINIPTGGLFGGVGATDAGTYTSHIMTDSGGSLGTYFGSPNYNNNRVAWEKSSYCRDCHDAGVTDESDISPGTISSNNFPHYTQGYSRFLTGALYFSSATSTIGSDEGSASADGICLKCHRGSSGTGVGFDY